ncbi:Na(+)/H(+) antiporter subunit B [bacterium]|nr:Na(+)/H(+) antiporter subunit B [bacterium]
MRDQVVLRIIVKSLMPFILLYALYVLLHGELSAGGGFQAGVIWAAAFILHGLVFGTRDTQRFLSMLTLCRMAAIGLAVYLFTGVGSMLRERAFLTYGALADDAVKGQLWGIMLVEIGICLTVGAVMLAIFYAFSGYRGEKLGAGKGHHG